MKDRRDQPQITGEDVTVLVIPQRYDVDQRWAGLYDQCRELVG